jgi:recombination protein RecR
MFPRYLSHFIKVFSKLPGIGYKSSERLGFYLLSQPQEYSVILTEAILDLKRNTKICSLCGNISESDPCHICNDGTRDNKIICIVEKPIDIYYIESTNSFKGLYHVLGGIISPLNGITPKDLKITEFLERLKKLPVDEVLFATSPTTEGDTTALYIKEIIKSLPIRFTHLARGIPVGTGLQYAGCGSLSQAIIGREELK